MNWLARLGRIFIVVLGIALLADFLWGIYLMARGTIPATASNNAREVAALFLGGLFLWASTRHRA